MAPGANMSARPAGNDPAAQLYMKGDYAGALAIWTANEGDADALFNLGQLYRQGRGVAADRDRAMTYYQRAATKGHAVAQVMLGRMLIEDDKLNDAIPWIAKAAAQGNAPARYLLGTLYVNGDGLPQDAATGYAYFIAASMDNVPEAVEARAAVEPYLTKEQRAEANALAMLWMNATPASARTAPPPNFTYVGAPVADPAPPRPPSPPPEPVTPDKPSARPPAPSPAPVRPAAKGNWAVQLGAFQNASQAETAWSGLVGRHGDLLRDRRPSYVPFRNVVRLRIVGFSQGNAAAVCAQLKARGSACFIAQSGSMNSGP